MEPSTEILDEIMLKFVTTAPTEHLTQFEQLMFLVEHAHWYYEDHVREKISGLKQYSKYADFANVLFQKCESLKPYANQVGEIVQRFYKYKLAIPVFGGILLDKAMERVLLVRGYRSGSGWGFPRGKVNQNETDAACAAREVLEETGMDIEQMIKPEDFIEVYTDGKQNKLFIITGLDPDTAVFAPRVQKEIGAYGWHYLKDLPSTVDEANQVYMAQNGNRHRFFMVQPFVKKLRDWVRRRKAAEAAAAGGAQGAGAAAAGGNHKGKKAPGSSQASRQSSFRLDPAVGAAAAAATAVAAAAAAAAADAISTHHYASGAGRGGPAQQQRTQSHPAPNLVMSSSFRFDWEPIMACLAVSAS